MKEKRILFFFLLLFFNHLQAQQKCLTSSYQQQELRNNPSLAEKISSIEKFAKSQINSANYRLTGNSGIIKIPVVVHILYHSPSENISDDLVRSQIDALNRDFRRMAADTVKTPSFFKSLAADCEIEFQLAISDPQRISTTGIIHKYTPINYWVADDKMKFSLQMGDDAWDAKSYLNIWVCNLDQVAGYSSVPGGDDNKDGVVISYTTFGNSGISGYNMGRTAVHEVGHWLNLKHLWGDKDCGDDLVDDTPKQSTYNQDCPSVARISCGNGPYGDMFMNYMDFVSDGCMNLFTNGQKERMRALFVSGGIRNSILSSTGLSTPLIFEIPLPDQSPRWLHPQLYPNPTTSRMTLDLSYDVRWVGKTINVINMQGQVVMQILITSQTQKIDVSRLYSGLYFLKAKKEDGDFIEEKFVKF